MNLASKLRPLVLEDIIGQDVVIRSIRRAFELDRIAAAYLCIGKHGTGKTTSARVIARLLLCSQRAPGSAVACGVCLNCQASARDACPDIQEHDASNLGKDDVKSLKTDAQFRPMYGDKKVFIIDEVHAFSHQGFQALLKILEEPPDYVHFILATTELSKVPKTIISRCQKLTFHDLPETLIVERLRTITKSEQTELSDEMLSLIAHLGEGSLRDAISILESVMINGYSSAEAIYAHFGIPNELQTTKLANTILLGDNFEYAKVLTVLEIQDKLNLARCYTMLLDHLSKRLIGNPQVGQYCARLLMYLMGAQSLFSNPHLKPRMIFDTIIMRVIDEMAPFKTADVLRALG